MAFCSKANDSTQMCIPHQSNPHPLPRVKNQREFEAHTGSASGLTNVSSAPPHHHLAPCGPPNGSEGRGIMQFVRKGINAAITMSTQSEQILGLIVSTSQPSRSSAGKAQDPKEIIFFSFIENFKENTCHSPSGQSRESLGQGRWMSSNVSAHLTLRY